MLIHVILALIFLYKNFISRQHHFFSFRFAYIRMNIVKKCRYHRGVRFNHFYIFLEQIQISTCKVLEC